MNSDRRRELTRIIKEGRVDSQKAIARQLLARGHRVTQATVSRDLRFLGATKIRVGDTVAYRLPEELPRVGGGDLMARGLSRALREFAVDLRPADSIVVVATAPGHAAAVARAIDLAGVAEVAGTVAGDDTIFVATAGAGIASALAARWTSEAGIAPVVDELGSSKGVV